MEDFGLKLGSHGLPIYLSTIGRKYVMSIWQEISMVGISCLVSIC